MIIVMPHEFFRRAPLSNRVIEVNRALRHALTDLRARVADGLAFLDLLLAALATVDFQGAERAPAPRIATDNPHAALQFRPLPDGVAMPVAGQSVHCLVDGYVGCCPVTVISSNGDQVKVQRADGSYTWLRYAPSAEQLADTWHVHAKSNGTSIHGG